MKKYLLVFTLLISVLSYGQADDTEELAKKLANPVASLISVPSQNNSDHGIGASNGSRFTLNIQPVIPISISKKVNLIARWVQPIISQYNITGMGEREYGLADAVVSSFISPKDSKKGFTWGAGPVFLLPLGTNNFLTTGKFCVGPTIIGLMQKNGWTYGLLWNQLWSVTGSDNRPDVSQMFTQPFVAYNWKSGAGITLAAEYTETWINKSSNVFLIPTFSGLTTFGKKQKVSFAVGPRFNIIAPKTIRSNFGFRAAITLIFPKS